MATIINAIFVVTPIHPTPPASRRTHLLAGLLQQTLDKGDLVFAGLFDHIIENVPHILCPTNEMSGDFNVCKRACGWGFRVCIGFDQSHCGLPTMPTHPGG